MFGRPSNSVTKSDNRLKLGSLFDTSTASNAGPQQAAHSRHSGGLSRVIFLLWLSMNAVYDESMSHTR